MPISATLLRQAGTCSYTANLARRQLSCSAIRLDASQPAPSHPQAARTANSPSGGGGDARSRLAKLQAQRLEELNRGRSGGAGGGAARPNKPQQKWSNRTLIALATSVGACTYLMGTYHGYNAGKAHAEQAFLEASGADVAPFKAGVPAAVLPANQSAGVVGAGQTTQAQIPTSLLPALAQLLPFSTANNPFQCEPRDASGKCRLAELTQYHCDLHTNRVVCQPIDRIFRM